MFLAPNLNNANTVHPCIVATSGISNESMNALAHSTSHIGLVSCHRDSSVCMLQANEAVLSRNPSELTDLNLGTSYFSVPHLRLPIRLRHSAISAANQNLYQMITRGGAAHLSSPKLLRRFQLVISWAEQSHRHKPQLVHSLRARIIPHHIWHISPTKQ